MRSDSNSKKSLIDTATLATNLKVSRTKFRILPWGYAHEREYFFKQTFSLNEKLAQLLEILPEEIIINAELQNLSGANPDATGIGELLRVSYTQNGKDEGEEEFQGGIFCINTKFARFEGSRNIVFALNRKNSLDDSINNPRALLLKTGGSITSISITLQWYERRFASLLGLFPVATRSLHLALTPESLSATIKVQRQESRILVEQLSEELAQRWVEMLQR